MGKQRRQRQKFHTPSSSPPKTSADSSIASNPAPLTFTPIGNIFENIKIDLPSLKNSLDDDTRSVKSFKSIKSEACGDKPMTKKAKLKLRREYLRRRIDTINQMKKQAGLRDKRKKTALIGDTNPLHDALPSLESLINGRPKTKGEPKIVKKKAILKASARKRCHASGVQAFKKIMSNKDFLVDPLQAISEHVKAAAERETSAAAKRK